jgi:DNA-directed RNA polymerase specialized sigma24 family protein
MLDQLVVLQPALLKRARHLTDNKADAEDLVQDVMVLALRFQSRFDGRNLWGWLVTIMHNRAMTQRRREQLRTCVELKDFYIGGDVEKEAMARLELAAVLPAASTVALLFYGLTEKELGIMQHRSPHTIGSRASRERARAKRISAA